MTMKEEKKLRHLLARFNNVKHSSVEVLRAETITNDKRRVYAKIRGFECGFLFQGNNIVESWVVI